jgi:metallo-beta-lactamase family protein
LLLKQLLQKQRYTTVFIVHGEEKPAEALAKLIEDCCDEPPVIPQLGDSFEI